MERTEELHLIHKQLEFSKMKVMTHKMYMHTVLLRASPSLVAIPTGLSLKTIGKEGTTGNPTGGAKTLWKTKNPKNTRTCICFYRLCSHY